MKKDQIKDRIKAAKGKLQDVATRTMGYENMEEDGKEFDATGRLQADQGNRGASAQKAHPNQ